MYLPRAKAADAGVEAGFFTTGDSAAGVSATKQHTRTGTQSNFRSMFITAPPRNVGWPP
jgi:hypothetical protein